MSSIFRTKFLISKIGGHHLVTTLPFMPPVRDRKFHQNFADKTQILVKFRQISSNFSFKLGFRDFLLKAELLRAIVDCGFEHPSEVQHECIPQAILGWRNLHQNRQKSSKFASKWSKIVEISSSFAEILQISN